MKEYKSLDIMKLIMAFMVVAIHNDPFGAIDGYRYPLLLLPVPIFFIISSFLFFKKRLLLNDKERKIQVSKFIIRNIRLYLAWFMVLLPFTILIRGYFKNGIINSVLQIIIDFLFGSTFRSSWFIMANVIGIIIVCYLNKRICIVLSIGLYIICLLRTCYMGVLPEQCFLNRIIDLWPATFYQSFPIAIVWAAIGRLLSETYAKWNAINVKNLIFPTVVSLIVLGIEYEVLEWMQLIVTPGYSVAMIPVCILCFMVVCKIKINKPFNPKLFREISTVMYCMSTTLGWILIVLLKKLGISEISMPISCVVYVIIIAVSILSTSLIRRLKKIKFFTWCEYLT